MAGKAPDIKDANALRRQFQREAEWCSTTETEGEHRYMRIAWIVYRIREERLWQAFKDKKDKPMHSFNAWIKEESVIDRGTLYQLIRVREVLVKVSEDRLEKLGKSRCYELARLGKNKPKMLMDAVNRVLAENLSVKEVKHMVANALAGLHLDSQRYEHFEFLVPRDSALEVRRALAVQARIDPLQNPEIKSATGVHLAAICVEYLSGEDQKKVWKQLEKAGFQVEPEKKAAFKVEE